MGTPAGDNFLFNLYASLFKGGVISRDKVGLNITSSNAENHQDVVYMKNVYHFLSQSFTTCITYDPPAKSATGFVDRARC